MTGGRLPPTPAGGRGVLFRYPTRACEDQRVNRSTPRARRLLGTLRSRAKVTARLRELAPLTRWRERTWTDLLGINRTVLVQALKIALSASFSWALAQWLFGSPAPIYAPITASFVALITISASIRDAYERVLGVLVGIFV